MRFEDFWQLRMMFEVAGAVCVEPPESPVEDGEALDPGETRGVPNPIDIRVLFVQRSTERSSGRLISRVRRIRRCTQREATRPPEVYHHERRRLR